MRLAGLNKWTWAYRAVFIEQISTETYTCFPDWKTEQIRKQKKRFSNDFRNTKNTLISFRRLILNAKLPSQPVRRSHSEKCVNRRQTSENARKQMH